MTADPFPRRLRMLIALALCAGLPGCSYDAQPSSDAIASARREQQASSTLVPADTTVDPCSDFYQYACNRWIQAHPPRPDRPMVGRGLDGVQERTRLWMWNHLSATGPGEAGSPLPVLYASCMDEDAAKQRGLQDVAPLFHAIAAGNDPASLLRAVAALHRAGVPALFSTVVGRDWTAPDRGLLRLGPATLPPQAFAGDDRDGARARQRYYSYVKITLGEADEVPDPIGAAEHAVSVEQRLAAAVRPAASEFDARRLDRADFDRLVAPLPFGDYFAAAGVAQPREVAVSDAAYLDAVRALVVEQGPAVQDYLRWALVRAVAPELPGAIRDVRFEYEKPDRQPRWQHCVEAAEVVLPDEVARLYERAAVSAETRASVQAMAEAVQRAAVRQLERAEWLDPATRRAAADKVGRMVVRVGRSSDAPTPLALQSNAYLANLLAANAQAWDRMGAQIGAGPDPGVGLAPASTANAFYRHGLNDIVVPLALAQPPFLGDGQSAAANYGALGTVIGHEVAHAFDRAGRQVDADGRRVDWAVGSDETLRGRERCLSERLAQEAAAPRYDRGPQLIRATTVDAERTADEHQSDVAGVTFAYDAYREYADTHQDAPGAAVGTDRIFFLAYAQSWCTSVHPLVAHWLARADVHAPAPARVNAALAQVPQFGETFDCAIGTPLRPRQTCALW